MKKPSRSRLLVAFAAALSVVMVGAGALVLVQGDGRDAGPAVPAGRASQLRLPRLTTATRVATKRFLAGAGKPIARFETGSRALDGIAISTRIRDRTPICKSVATRLAPVTPGSLLVAAVEVPDRTLGDLEQDKRRVVSDALVACARRDVAAMNRSLRSLSAIDALVARRMKEVTR